MKLDTNRYSQHYRYFYKGENRRFIFYQLPQELLTNEAFKDYSLHCKVLYSILLNRTSLSEENGWVDEKGRIYVHLSIKEACNLLSCSNKSCVKYFNELDEDTGIGLIRRVRPSFNSKTIRIYVCDFTETLVWDNENHCILNDKNTQAQSILPNSVNTPQQSSKIPACNQSSHFEPINDSISKSPVHYQSVKITPENNDIFKYAGHNQSVKSATWEDQSVKITLPKCKNYTTKVKNLHPNNNNINNNNINNNSTCKSIGVSLSPSLESNTNLQDIQNLEIDMTCNGIPTLQEVLDFGESVRDTPENSKRFFKKQSERGWRFDTGAWISDWKSLYLKWKEKTNLYQNQIKAKKETLNQNTKEDFIGPKTPEEKEYYKKLMDRYNSRNKNQKTQTGRTA